MGRRERGKKVRGREIHYTQDMVYLCIDILHGTCSLSMIYVHDLKYQCNTDVLRPTSAVPVVIQTWDPL